MISLPDVPRLDNPGLYELLLAMRKMVVSNSTLIEEAQAALADVDTGGGDVPPPTAYERDPPSFVLDYGGDTNPTSALTAYDAAAAKNMYVRSGEYTTSRLYTAFNKHMEGQGQFILTDRAVPAKYGYMAAKPTTWAAQGLSGWFRGDQWFTDGGEWKTIGPLVRTYDINARYFESNVIPHHAWWEVESGNSSIQGYITGGVTPGNSVNIVYNGSQEWVGKQVQIKQSFGGAVLATLTVASVVGPVITFTTSHTVTCAWNPAAGLAPNISFAPRTWGGYRYLLVRMRGGGDVYGDIVRMNIEYQPRQPELVHAFNGGTGGQYGGSVDFINVRTTLSGAASTGSSVLNVNTLTAGQQFAITGKRLIMRPWVGGPVLEYRGIVSCTANTITMTGPPASNYPAGTYVEVGPDGTYATGWESQYNDQGADVSVIAHVDSFSRENDRADFGGRVWLGMIKQSSGPRSGDAAYVASGYWRRGLDLVNCNFIDGSYLTTPANAGATFFQVKWPSGARVGAAIRIRWGASEYNGTITVVSGTSITVTPGMNANYPVDSQVDFTSHGAAISMKTGQWINWDASASGSGRGGDPLGVWGPIYGNTTGTIWTGADAGFWATYNGAARIRLGTASFISSVTIQSGEDVHAARDLITSGSAYGLFQGAVTFGSGSNDFIAFNTGLNRFEFYVDGVLVHSIP